MSNALAMTPSVALRALFEQMRTFQPFLASGRSTSVFTHFVGPITPPKGHTRRPIGDPVFDAVAEYAARVVARAGLLSTRAAGRDNLKMEEYGRLTRSLRADEHSLAIDLGRVAGDIPLRHRQTWARAVLAVASFWSDRSELLRIGAPDVNPLLGGRPSDAVGIVLWEHALVATAPPRPRNSAGGGLDNDGDIDMTIGISLTPAG